MKEKIDKSAEELKGLYYELNDEETEISFPPVQEHVIESVDVESGYVPLGTKTGCGGQVEITNNGNPTYKYFYIENKSDKDAKVTVEKMWTYQNQIKTERSRLNLFPGEKRNFFSMPRNQNPDARIINCSLH